MPFARIGKVTLHYRTSGPDHAPPLVLSNSLGTDARIWDAVIPHFQQRYRVISYDKRGHGLSDSPSAPYRLVDHAADLLGLTDYLELDRFALAGISVGGLIAQQLAATEPRRIAALVLCNTAAMLGPREIWEARIATVRASGIAFMSDPILARWFTPVFRQAHPVDLAGWRNLLERCPIEGYVGTCAAIRDADLRRLVPGIGLRTLVVAGEGDLSTPPELVREMAGLLPDARFEIIPECGHIPSIEQPVALARLMQSYFGEVGYV